MPRSLELAKRHIRFARSIHAEWAEWFAQATDEEKAAPVAQVEAQGDVEWHAEWVRRYDRVLRELEKVNTGTGPTDLELHVRDRHADEYLLHPRGARRRPMDRSSVHRWFKRCLRVAGLPETIEMHEMRHSAADHLWRDSGNLVLAGELLRHVSPETTRVYLVRGVWRGE